MNNQTQTHKLLGEMAYPELQQVYNHCYQMLESHQHLKPTAGSNAEGVLTLRFDGTVRISYKMNEYHIPLVIWIPKGFPSYPPVIYVVQKPGMRIASNHPIVNDTGMCSF